MHESYSVRGKHKSHFRLAASRLLLGGLISLIILSHACISHSQPFIVPHTVDKAIIIDQVLIKKIADEMLIPLEDEKLEKMEIIDITQDGFGKNDIAKVYPSGKYYRVTEISDSLEEEMGSWKREASQDITFNLESSKDFYNLYEQRQSPQYLLLSSIAYALERVYKESLPIELYFRRDASGITFNYWGYDADSLTYRPSKPVDLESSTAYDLMYILQSDTTIITDTTLYDVMLIYKTLADTIFVPRTGEIKPGRGPLQEDDRINR